MSDYYSKPMMRQFINSAKKYGVDPYDFLALGISESGLGHRHPSNPTRVDIGQHFPQYPPPYGPPMEELVDFSAKYLAEQLKKYSDKLSAIQAYSGTGKTIYGGSSKAVKEEYGTTKMFGRPFQEIDFWKEKPQAKRVMSISEQLKKTPEVANLIRELARQR